MATKSKKKLKIFPSETNGQIWLQIGMNDQQVTLYQNC